MLRAQEEAEGDGHGGLPGDRGLLQGVPDTPPPYAREYPYIPRQRAFPDSKQGVKDAFEFLKESVAYVSSRSFCDDCLALERPRKCFRIQGADVCGQCLLKKALE